MACAMSHKSNNCQCYKDLDTSVYDFVVGDSYLYNQEKQLSRLIFLPILV